jgi:integrase
VRRGLHRVAQQGLVYEEPKADRSRRTLALPRQLVEALRAHRAAQLEEREAAGPLWQDNDLVFAQANGRPIERKSDWKSLLQEANVRDVRLHDGRHTAATLLLSEGVHPGSSWRSSATRKCARRPTPTATSCPHSAGTRRTG